MITQEMMSKVQDKVHSTMKKALGPSYNNDVKVTFRTDMKHVGGYAYMRSNRIELNEQLFLANEETFFKDIIVHECAHLIQYVKYPRAKQAHGPEFKYIMVGLGSNPDRCHTMDVSVAFAKPMYQYKCSCTTHNLSKLIHNKVQNGSNRVCSICKTRISFIGMSK